MAMLVVMIGNQKDICQDAIGLCAQNIDVILRFSSEHHNWKALCDHLKVSRVFHIDLL